MSLFRVFCPFFRIFSFWDFQKIKNRKNVTFFENFNGFFGVFQSKSVTVGVLLKETKELFLRKERNFLNSKLSEILFIAHRPL